MTMIKAVRIQSTGDADVIETTTVQTPDAGPGEVRVRHAAIGVNFIDTYHRSGLYPVQLPSGLGLEAAGTVEAVGPGVTSLREGDRVAYCTGPIGAYSDAHVVGADRLVKLPEKVSFEVAAASMLKGLTAQYLIRQIRACGQGDAVLFHAGAGGVGQIAVQWLKALGATVITTVGSEEKAEIVRELGADHVILYREESVPDRVAEITGGKKLPIVYDGVGASTFEGSLDSLQKRGMLVTYGNASGAVTGVDLGILSQKGSLFLTRPRLMDYVETEKQLQSAAADYFGALTGGSVTIQEPTVYPLREAAQAHRDLEGRKTTGSSILKP